MAKKYEILTDAVNLKMQLIWKMQIKSQTHFKFIRLPKKKKLKTVEKWAISHSTVGEGKLVQQIGIANFHLMKSRASPVA